MKLNTAMAECLFRPLVQKACRPSIVHMTRIGMTLNPCLVCFFIPKDVWRFLCSQGATYACLIQLHCRHSTCMIPYQHSTCTVP